MRPPEMMPRAPARPCVGHSCDGRYTDRANAGGDHVQCPVPVQGRRCGDCGQARPGRRGDCARRRRRPMSRFRSTTRRSITRTRWHSPIRPPSCASGRWCPASTRQGPCSTAAAIRVGRRATRSCSMAGVSASRIGADWRSAHASRATGSCAPAAALDAPGNGDRDSRLYRDAVRHGARGPGRAARRRGAGHRRDRRRRIDRHDAAGAARLPCDRQHGQGCRRADYLEGTRRQAR